MEFYGFLLSVIRLIPVKSVANKKPRLCGVVKIQKLVPFAGYDLNPQEICTQVSLFT